MEEELFISAPDQETMNLSLLLDHYANLKGNSKVKEHLGVTIQALLHNEILKANIVTKELEKRAGKSKLSVVPK